MTPYVFGPYVILHEDGVTFAAIPPDGDVPSSKHATADISRAARFESWGAATDASQNFCSEWNVEDL